MKHHGFSSQSKLTVLSPQYKSPGSEPHVIILDGHDEELAKLSTLVTLLEGPVLLVFFNPSQEILLALNDAANCGISIPDIKLEPGIPILIHR